MNRAQKIGLSVLGGIGLAGVVGWLIEKSAAAKAPGSPQGCPVPSGNVAAYSPVTYTARYAQTGTSLTMNVGDKLQTLLLITSPGTDWSLTTSDDSVIARNTSQPHVQMADTSGAGGTDAADYWVAVGTGSCSVYGSQVGGGGTFTIKVQVTCAGS
jgi:predicted secreted protein